MPEHQKLKPFLSQYSGFNLHAGIFCPSHGRKKRERLCRYISRPSLSEERLSVNSQGQVVYKLKTAYHNGTTHIVLEPLDFLSRLTALIPKPRVHLIRFHLGENSKIPELAPPREPPKTEHGFVNF